MNDAFENSRVIEITLAELLGPLIDRWRTKDQIARMVESLRSVGQLNPIVVTRKHDAAGFLVVCGWTRTEAAKILGWPSLQAIVLDGDDAVKLTQFAVVDNTARSNPNLHDAWQQALLLLKVTGEPQSEVAKMLGYTPSTLSRLLRMAPLEPCIQEALKAETLHFDDAYALACISEPARRLELFEELQAGSRPRGSLKTLTTKARTNTPRAIRIAGQPLRVPNDTDPVVFLKDVVRQFQETLKAFKATGQDSGAFFTWLETQNGDRHVEA